MKTFMLVMAIVLSSTPAFAGHYNQQIWRFYTDDCDQVASGSRCTLIELEVSTSTWCGLSCSWSEKTDTFNKAINALLVYFDTYLRASGFRDMVVPVCSTYQSCYSTYSGGYDDGQTSVTNFGDWSTDFRQDFPVFQYTFGTTKL